MEHVLSVQTTEQAIFILREKGVVFDRGYRVDFMPEDWSKSSEHFASTFCRYGLHVYFNDGDRRNVAYFTPSMTSLTIHDVPIPDFTENRVPVESWLIQNS